MPEETEVVTAEHKNEGLNFKHELYEWAEAVVFSLVLVVLLFTFIFRIVGVEGQSMENTLHDGDRLILSHLNYTPKQHDIVVLTTHAVDKPIIKRVIAVAGQTVNIDFVKSIVYVNGKALTEKYIKEPTVERGTVVFPVTVPKGHVFVMGDNRNNSFDSRFVEVGMVDTRDILGKAEFRIFPFDKIGKTD